MQDTFYRLGYYIMYAIPIFIALFCLRKIRKNRAEIKRLEAKRKAERNRQPYRLEDVTGPEDSPEKE